MVVLVMGVSGSGKTTIGEALAAALQARFLDADDLHPQANRLKMAAGIPLEDADRWPWLDRVRAEIDRALDARLELVLACSALKERYRQRLGVERPQISTVLLRGDPALLEARLRARKGHFMPASLLQSQLSTLEPPAGQSGRTLLLDVAPPPAALVETIRAWLGR